MEAKYFSHATSPVPSLHPPRHVHKLNNSNVLAVLTRPSTDNIGGVTKKDSLKPEDVILELTKKTVYNDNWLEQLAINHLSQSFQAATGLRNNKCGYKSLVQAAMDAYQNFSENQQLELVLQALNQATPKLITDLTKILPSSQFKREQFAAFTTVFFAWLVGHCKVRESEFNGRKENNVVYIKKCRFLEESNCVGMCTNLCKIPTQTFIKDSFGMPVNMVPNFDDMSCEMIFGQDPPALAEDPALQKPCYKLCKSRKKHSKKCAN